MANAAAGMPGMPGMVNDGGGYPPPHTMRVIVVDQLSKSQLRQLAHRGAVGLLVPGVGARTDQSTAIASLVRGENVNPSQGRYAHGRRLIGVAWRKTIPRTDGFIVMSLPQNRTLASNDRRYPIAIVGYGFHGLLTSPTTRIEGLVAITDVAPTALGRLRGVLGWRSSTRPLLRLQQLDVRIHANNRLKMPTLIVVACVLMLLAAMLPRATMPAILAALVANLVAGATHISNEPVLIVLMFVATLVGGIAIARFCMDERRLLALIVLVLVLHVVLLVTRPDWVAVTPLGPTQNSRFWGIGNQLETLLLAPVVAGASLAARRYGTLAFAAFALFALVLVTDNRLGSDGGGAIVFAVALAFVGARSWRHRARGFLAMLTLATLSALAIIGYDLRTPGPNHLRSAFSHGISGVFAVAVDRLPLAYVPALHQWKMVTPIAVAFALTYLLAVRSTRGYARDLVLGAGLAIVTSLLVNDSASYELAGGIAVVAALARSAPAVEPAPDG